jgi:hypothetical protein
MKFDALNYWDKWAYLPLMDRLMIFELLGGRVAEWFVTVHEPSYYPESWEFHCLVNTLPKEKKPLFERVVEEWKQYVDKRLQEVKTYGR